MSRFVDWAVVAEGELKAGQPPLSLKDYLGRVAKYVPSEIIALFLFLNGIAATAPSDLDRRIWFGVAFGVCLALTPTYFLWVIGTPADPRRYQATVSTIGFIIWAYGLGSGFFAAMHWYFPIGAAFAVAIFSTLSGWLQPKKDPEAEPPQSTAGGQD